MRMAVYVVSDLHGHMDVFMEGLNKIGFSDEDKLYVIGDAIDRGPKGIELLSYIMEHENMNLLLGNHEYMMLDVVDPEGGAYCIGNDTTLWRYYNGGEVTFEAYSKLSEDERKALLSWLNHRMLIKVVEAGGRRFCLTHSFYIPKCEGQEFCEMDTDYAWAIVWASMFRDGDTKCKDIYANYDYTFITGHVPVQRVRAEYLRDRNYNRLESYRFRNFVDIDGGCAIGFKKNVKNGAIFLRLDDMEEFAVEITKP